MIVDFHTHFFPKNIASQAIKTLSEIGKIKPFGDGTDASLLQFMEEDGVELSLNQPVATRAEQVVSINRQMIDFNRVNKKIFSFGALHPDFSKVGKVREEIEFITNSGLKGIKLHPEHQSFYPDDPKMAEIYEACRDSGLIILFHSGKDIGFETLHASPERFAQVSKIKGLKIVLGHMGGYRMWDDVEQYLVGLPSVYFDTAFSLEMENWQMKEIILGHGPNQVLFGSDFPWQRQKDLENKIRSLDLGKNIEDFIFFKNAKWLLDI